LDNVENYAFGSRMNVYTVKTQCWLWLCVFRVLRSTVDPTERRRVGLLQPFMGRVQGRIQRQWRQLLARQRPAVRADAVRTLQAQVCLSDLGSTKWNK